MNTQYSDKKINLKFLLASFLRKILRRFLSYKTIVNISSLINFPIAPPLTASVSITLRCNSKCYYCDVWKWGDFFPDPTIEELKKIFSSLANLGVKVVTLSGGEPLLRKDIEEIISIINNHNMRAQIVTNGVLLSKEKINRLVQSRLTSITLSLDTVDPEVYQKLRGVPFEIAQRALESLIYIKEESPQIYVGISCVINRYNIGKLVPLVEKITDISKGKILINFQSYERVPGRVNDDLIPDPEMYPALRGEIEKLIEMKGKGFPISNSSTFLTWIPDFLIYNKMPKGFKCTAGYTGVYIWSDLMLHPCNQLPAIADLHKEDLEDVWFSHKFKEQRIKMKRRECRGCLLYCHTEQTLYEWADKIDKVYQKRE
jgi:MoaA/NifB/PqqE/SkfB family radical SAM enzyme